jgi:hypothetical protein
LRKVLDEQYLIYNAAESSNNAEKDSSAEHLAQMGKMQNCYKIFQQNFCGHGNGISCSENCGFLQQLRNYLLLNKKLFHGVTYCSFPFFFNFAQQTANQSQEIPRIYGTRKSLTVPTSARHLSLS